MKSSFSIFLSLGSNLGDRQKHLEDALEELKKTGILSCVSLLYETEPFGKKDQPWFLNMCAELQTTLPPEELFAKCQEIEKHHGRVHREKWGPRPLDMDILFYDDVILNLFQDPAEMLKRVRHDKSGLDAKPFLQIPHHGIPERRFVLLPLAEIAPDFVHPFLKKNIREWLKDCPDTSIVRPLP